MMKVLCDFNKTEGSRGVDYAVVLHPKATPTEALVVGKRIVVIQPGEIECEAIVKHGRHHQWVAEVVEDSMRFLDE